MMETCVLKETDVRLVVASVSQFHAMMICRVPGIVASLTEDVFTDHNDPVVETGSEPRSRLVMMETVSQMMAVHRPAPSR